MLKATSAGGADVERALDAVLHDHGVDQLDHGLLILGREGLERPEAVEQPRIVQRRGVGAIAGRQVVDCRAEDLG